MAWEFQDSSGRWHAMDSQLSTKIENLFSSGRASCQTDFQGGNYVYDFLNMTQRRVETNKIRRLRRTPIPYYQGMGGSFSPRKPAPSVPSTSSPPISSKPKPSPPKTYLPKTSSPSVVWEVMLSGEWMPFDGGVSRRLEAGYLDFEKDSRQSTVLFDHSDHRYEADFKSWTQMNTSSKTKRPIRRSSSDTASSSNDAFLKANYSSPEEKDFLEFVQSEDRKKAMIDLSKNPSLVSLLKKTILKATPEFEDIFLKHLTDDMSDTGSYPLVPSDLDAQWIPRAIASLKKGSFLDTCTICDAAKNDPKTGNLAELTSLVAQYCAMDTLSDLGKIKRARELVKILQPLSTEKLAFLSPLLWLVGALVASNVDPSSIDLRVAAICTLILTHPLVSELPSVFVKMAKSLLMEHCGVFFGKDGAGSKSSLLRKPRRGADDKREKGVPSDYKQYPSMVELYKLIGIESIKTAFCSLIDQTNLDKSRGLKSSSSKSALFYGNPGTGKTTVARIYGQLLADLKLIPNAKFIEATGVELASGGVTELEKKLQDLNAGGLLFVDEAYQLNPKNNPIGGQVLDKLLTEIENKRDRLVVVFAGYKKNMEVLLEYNPGLPSRFPQVFTFSDYTDEQLEVIFPTFFKDGFHISDKKYFRIAARRLGGQRGTEGFGNARAVRIMVENALKKQSSRVIQLQKERKKCDLFEVTREDLLGPLGLDKSKLKAWQQIEGMIGLESVKKSMSNLIDMIQTNAQLEEDEKPLRKFSLNQLFLGPPGTGKTTIAKLYGNLLCELGLLSKGETIVKNPSHFIGNVLGASEEKTNKALDEAQGNVLVIDEAYGLHTKNGTDIYKTAVVDTIVARVQNVIGGDMSVIMLGYEEQMKEFLRETNPGLQGRFQLENAWIFENYDDEALLQILLARAKEDGLKLSFQDARAGVEVLAKERMKPNFSNGRAVEILLKNASTNMHQRDSKTSTLIARDFWSKSSSKLDDQPVPIEKIASILDDLVACHEIKAKLVEYQKTVMNATKRGINPKTVIPFNFLFVGSPGTGKTTVAKRLGKIFECLGILGSSELIETSASDFSTGYEGQAAKKTREIFESARGKVLFIDEAYRLNPRNGGTFAGQALGEIVNILTEDKFKGNMVTILAGYQQDVEDLLLVNSGLKSRFNERIVFEDFSEESAANMFVKFCQKEFGLRLSKDAQKNLPQNVKLLLKAPSFSNGRDIENWAKATMRKHLSSSDGEEIEGEALKNGLEELIASKNVVGSSSSLPPQISVTSPLPVATMTDVQKAPRVVLKTDIKVSPEVAQKPKLQSSTKVVESINSYSDIEFTKVLQDELEGAFLMEDFRNSRPLPKEFYDRLGTKLGKNSAFAVELVKKFEEERQRKLKEIEEAERKLEEERKLKLKAKAKRPVWRCAACGRYNCNFAPYIERYEEIDI